MSPMDDIDLDRIGDKVKLAIREELAKIRAEIKAEFEHHVEREHDPLCARVEQMRETFWKWSGGLAIVTFLIGIGVAVVVR
jgi:hypothetical protein